jgi:hypothetical protein
VQAARVLKSADVDPAAQEAGAAVHAAVRASQMRGVRCLDEPQPKPARA